MRFSQPRRFGAMAANVDGTHAHLTGQYAERPASVAELHEHWADIGRRLLNKPELSSEARLELRFAGEIVRQLTRIRQETPCGRPTTIRRACHHRREEQR